MQGSLQTIDRREGLCALTEEDEREILLWKVNRLIWQLEVHWYAKRIFACTIFLGWHIRVWLLQSYGLW